MSPAYPFDLRHWDQIVLQLPSAQGYNITQKLIYALIEEGEIRGPGTYPMSFPTSCLSVGEGPKSTLSQAVS